MKYIAKTPIKFNADDRYEEGDEIELNDKQAKPLLAQVPPAIAIEAPAAPAKKEKDK